MIARRCSKNESLIFAGLGGFEQTNGARVAFSSEEHGDRFVVGRKLRRVEEALHLRKFFSERRRRLRRVEALLIFFGGIGEKCELFAVVGPGDVSFGVECAWESGGDADWRGVGLQIFDVDRSVAV